MSIEKRKNIKKPWPTQAAMEQVYELNLWGGTDAFYSGEGSHAPEIVIPYITAIQAFFKSFETPLTICDLGCGDFNIGKELVPFTQNYIAVDIVRRLIERNRKSFKAKNLEFHCLDIAKDTLPKADCAIIRQVLQHLSNAEVKNVVEKLSHYKYVILTEHIPKGKFEPNKDIISGQGIRIKKQSGLDLLVAPFNLKIKDQTELLTIELANNKGVIKTILYKFV